MLAPAIGLAALLAFLPMPTSADGVMDADAGRQAPVQGDDLETAAAMRAEVLASYTRLGACHDLLNDLYRWGVLDLVATGIAFGLINNTTGMARRAEAVGNHRLRREHADFVIGFCTAIMHVHMASRDRARDLPDLFVHNDAIGPILGSRIARLQAPDGFDPERCRAHIGKLEDADVIDEVADVMLRRELDNAIEQGTFGTPGQDSGQGFGHGLCSAVLNAVMGVPG